MNSRTQSSSTERTQPQPLPPPLPDKNPNLTLNLTHRSPIIKKGSPIAAGSPICSGRAPKRPSIQVDSTIGRETGRDSTIGRETRRDSTIKRETGTRYTKEKPHDMTFDSIASESTKYMEEILKSKRRKARMVSRYVVATFFLTNLMLVGFSILGSILVMDKLYPCISCTCEDTTLIRTSQAYAQLPTESSESPTLTQTQTRTQTQAQTSQGNAETSQETKGQTNRKRQETRNKDYTISILVQNTTDDSPVDFWSSWNDV